MMIYVKPAPGGRVRQPERMSRVMPDDGAFVPRDSYYERLILGGDVIVCDPPKEEAAPPPAATPEPEPTKSDKPSAKPKA